MDQANHDTEYDATTADADCEMCNGDGGWEVGRLGDNDPDTVMVPCPVCNGAE